MQIILLGGMFVQLIILARPGTQSPAAQSPAVMAAANGTVYILQNGKLSVYFYDPELPETSALFDKLAKGKLRLLTTQVVK